MKLSVKILIIVLTTLLCATLLMYSIVGIILLGPSKDASRRLLEKFNESSATSFIPSLYMDKEKADEILNSFDKGEAINTQTVTISIFEDRS
ncbi:MAG: hypothetical protein E7598_05245 [Ruminococcaceae bacterium]|nr:hypothetical protein [Oscillospiraceae bacterium]